MGTYTYTPTHKNKHTHTQCEVGAENDPQTIMVLRAFRCEFIQKADGPAVRELCPFYYWYCSILILAGPMTLAWGHTHTHTRPIARILSNWLRFNPVCPIQCNTAAIWFVVTPRWSMNMCPPLSRTLSFGMSQLRVCRLMVCKARLMVSCFALERYQRFAEIVGIFGLKSDLLFGSSVIRIWRICHAWMIVNKAYTMNSWTYICPGWIWRSNSACGASYSHPDDDDRAKEQCMLGANMSPSCWMDKKNDHLKTYWIYSSR